MNSTIFSLDVQQKRLTHLQPKSLADVGLSEPYDLEAWLASTSEGLFARNIMWLARQDRLSGEQRSDLVGVDELGNLVIAELKRGVVAEDAVTQALSYAAEYASKSAADLAEMFAAHSQKEGATGLVSKTGSQDDAGARLSQHVGDQEVNESQILLLVGEDFTAKALAICDYLNGASEEPSFSVECWRYGLFQTVEGANYFVLEQILPPPSIRQEIEEKREASKTRKYARDPMRMEFMWKLIQYLSDKKVTASRKPGQSYECRIKNTMWAADYDVRFSFHDRHPRLILPDSLRCEETPATHGLKKGKHWDGRQMLEFTDVDAGSAKFDEVFGKRLVKVVEHLAPASQKGASLERPTDDNLDEGGRA